jgi:nucleoid DNA-binding protein
MAKKKKKSSKVKAKPKAAAIKVKKPGPVRPIRSTLSKSALIGLIAEENSISRAQAAGAFASLEAALLGSVHPKGAGTFILPGLMKVSLRKVPARKAGTMVRNPGTGEMVAAKARPATVRVKVRPLKKLKTAATGG